MKKNKGITLIALIITIVVMLILVAVSVNILIKSNLIGVTEKTTEGYKTAAEDESKSSNIVIDGVDYSNVDEYLNGKSIAMFDTGTNVITKMHTLAKDGEIMAIGTTINLSINEIKKYEGTPNLTKMTEANIVSWTDGYKAFEQEPDKYRNIVPEGYKMCPIYMWFEENEGTEKRNFLGKLGTMGDSNDHEVKTGTIYWWSESKNVYLNPDSSNMFRNLPYLTNISGLQTLKTTYVTNMSSILAWSTANLQDVNALRDWDTTNVENMEQLLYAWNVNSRKLDINGLKNWNTSNVKNMSFMFVGTGIENTEPLRSWNTSKVTNMRYMFGNNEDGGTLNNLDGISNLDVSKVTNMEGMFYLCPIEDLNSISNWNINTVDNMSFMFSMCQNLTDASGINDWNIKRDCNFTNMFSNCSTHPNFTKITGTWDKNGTFTPN